MKENLRADVAIVGSGIAGCTVAETLTSLGKTVVLLSPVHSPAGSATPLSAGTWDCGPILTAQARDRVPFKDFVRSPAWKKATGSLLLSDPAMASDAALAFDRFHGDSGVFAELMRGSEDRPALLPTEGGRFRATYAAQKVCYQSDAMAWPGKKIGVVVCPQWRLPTEMWIPEWKRRLSAVSIGAELVPFKIALKGFDWPLSQLAARLEADPNVAQLFQEQIAKGLKDTPVDRLLFPPLFLEEKFHDRLQKESGIPVGEFISASEPTAGLRLARALQAKREGLGIERLPIVSARQPSLRQNIFLVTTAAGETLELKTRAVVLCTGKFLSGGLDAGTKLTETVLGLPLYVDRHRSISYADELKNSDDLFRLGVWLDEWHRPRNLDGTLAENLFASGSLVGGLDFSTGRFGLGFHTWLGRACGKKIHEWLG